MGALFQIIIRKSLELTCVKHYFDVTTKINEFKCMHAMII